jgi:hypothetical protein
MRGSIGAIAVAFLALSAAAAVEGQETADKYVLLATERTATMQQEIDDAAARGFRVFGASPNDGDEVIILLEKSPAKYQYRLLAATRIGTLQREISEAAGNGYHIVPRAVARKGDELLVLMEKGPGGPARSQYQVLSTDRTGTLQKEITRASNDGFDLIAVAKAGEHIAILERRAP